MLALCYALLDEWKGPALKGRMTVPVRSKHGFSSIFVIFSQRSPTWLLSLLAGLWWYCQNTHLNKCETALKVIDIPWWKRKGLKKKENPSVHTQVNSGCLLLFPFLLSPHLPPFLPVFLSPISFSPPCFPLLFPPLFAQRLSLKAGHLFHKILMSPCLRSCHFYTLKSLINLIHVQRCWMARKNAEF